MTLDKGIDGTFSNEDFDFTAFNIIGTDLHYESYLGTAKARGIENLNHWLYGYCHKENNKELNDLLTYDFFEQSACITKFYNSTEKRYYEVGDEKFVWPEIAHGTYNEKNQLYNVMVQKCNNKLLKHILGDGYQCKNDTEFNEYFNIKGTRLLYLYLLNNYINILDYYTPNNRFFYRIENRIYLTETTMVNLYFNPVLIKTDKGLIWNNIKENISYILYRNDEFAKNNEENNVYMAYGLYLKNTVEYYERT